MRKDIVQIAALTVYKAPEVLQLRACVSAFTEFLKEFPVSVRARSGFVTLSIFTTNGQKVMTLVEKRQAAGNHTVVFDATSLPSGVYIYRLQANGAEVTKKLTLVK